MFLFNFVLSEILDGIFDWIFTKITELLSEFFGMMGNLGSDLFELPWVQGITSLFSNLGWALFVVGMVVSVFEAAIEYQYGRGSFKDTAINAIKGFMSVSLFTTVPLKLYQLCISMQTTFTKGITSISYDDNTMGEMAVKVVDTITEQKLSLLLRLVIVILMGYAVIKVFLSCLKRGGLLVIQIAVGALYMFSVPRGYMDGFISWCKQVIGICFTSFLQATMLIAGLMIVQDHMLLGVGVMFASSEIPRIAQQFGMDTSAKANFSSSVYAIQSGVNTIRTLGGH